MALGKNRSRVSVKGGGLLKLRQISPTPSDTFLDVGFLQSTSLDDKYDMMTAKDERGFVIDFVTGGEEPVITAVLLQSTIDEVNLIKNADGIYYEAYYYCKLANGNIQELDIPLCKIKPGPKLDFKAATERTLSLELHMLSVNAVSTITRAPTDYNMDPTVNSFYVLIESATAKNAPSDTASSLKTAVF